jgi:3-oxoacyl-[acyl-carrier protein] reductase
MSELAGRVVLVTGAGSGLGREVALQAGAGGARLALMDVRADRLERVEAEARARGAETLAIVADLTREPDVARAVAAAVERFGQLDAVVNSAGVFYGGPIVETPMEQFDRVHAVNVRGLYLVCREAARVMLPRRSGHLVNVSSIAGKRGVVNESAYALGKWAVVGLGECLALELGAQNIRVSTVCPGGMDTPFWENDPRAMDTSRFLAAGDVARAIVGILALPEGVVVKEAQVYRPGS